VLITINENTLSEYPYISPINRNLLADILERLDDMGPDAILIDIIFDRATEPEADARLIDVIQNTSTPIVLGYLDNRTSLTPEQRRYQENWIETSGQAFGYLNLAESNDGVVRHIPSSDDRSCAFGELGYVRTCVESSSAYRRIDWLLPPRDGQPTFAEIPAHTLLSSPPGSLDPFVDGRVVLIGVTMAGVDQHRTPISDLNETQMMAGVEIHAHFVQQLIDGRAVRDLGLFGELGVFALGALLGVILSTYAVVRNRAALILFGLTWVLAALDVGLFVGLDLVVPGDAAAFAVILGFIGASAHRSLTASSTKPLADDLGVLM
jgi:CHASE2 domain-containing sensor protein